MLQLCTMLFEIEVRILVARFRLIIIRTENNVFEVENILINFR